eukprot:3743948-Amphidinium_carterae.2
MSMAHLILLTLFMYKPMVCALVRTAHVHQGASSREESRMTNIRHCETNKKSHGITRSKNFADGDTQAYKRTILFIIRVKMDEREDC